MATKLKEEQSNTEMAFQAPVIGWDGSLTGFGVVSWDVLAGFSCATIKVKSHGPERLGEIECHLSWYLNRNPNALVVMESYPMNPHSNANLFQMGQLHCVMERLLWDKGIRYLYVTPQQVKKFATGKCAAEKTAVTAAVLKQWGFDGEFHDNNQIDAFVLAKIGEGFLCPEVLANDHQREVIRDTWAYMEKNYPWEAGRWIEYRPSLIPPPKEKKPRKAKEAG